MMFIFIYIIGEYLYCWLINEHRIVNTCRGARSKNFMDYRIDISMYYNTLLSVCVLLN